jgi:hypothetical protein
MSKNTSALTSFCVFEICRLECVDECAVDADDQERGLLEKNNRVNNHRGVHTEFLVAIMNGAMPSGDWMPPRSRLSLEAQAKMVRKEWDEERPRWFGHICNVVWLVYVCVRVRVCVCV